MIFILILGTNVLCSISDSDPFPSDIGTESPQGSELNGLRDINMATHKERTSILLSHRKHLLNTLWINDSK